MREELSIAIQQNTVSHAYIFASENEAREFATALHPHRVDFTEIAPQDGKAHILTDDIEKLQEELKFKSYAGKRVVLISEADSMMAPAQNKLLKTLEEPLGDTVLILCAKRFDMLLPTILSRCVEIAAEDKAPELDAQSLELAESFWKLKKQNAAFFEKKAVIEGIVNDKDSSRIKALRFLDALEDIQRKELIQSLDASLSKSIKLTEETRNNINAGYSTGYSLKALALNI